MKYLIFLFLLISLMSCEKFAPVSENTTKVILHIDAPPDEIMIVRDNPYDFNYDYQIIKKAKLDKDFNFTFEVNLKEIGLYQLRTAENVFVERFYLYPGDELKITIDNSNPEDPNSKFEGKAAKANEYIKNLKTQFKKDQYYFDELNDTNSAEFIKWVDTRYSDMISYFKDFFYKDSIPEFVRKNELSYIEYESAIARNDWSIRHYYYAPQNWDKQVIPENYFSFLKNLNLVEPYLSLFLSQYLEALIWEWHIKQIKSGIQPTAQTRELAKFQIAKQKFFGESSDIAMSLVLNDLLVMEFDERMMEVINNVMTDYSKTVQNKKYMEVIDKVYKKRLSLLKGNPAPNFTLPNLFNAPISLKDFKGKTVYCYFWSNQYQPSRDMVKFLNQIQLYNLRNPNVTFISVAMEENTHDKWKSIVQADSLTGIQLYSEGLFSNKVALDYMINTLPYALIVDKEGRIAMMNAPYPTDKKLIDILTGFMSK